MSPSRFEQYLTAARARYRTAKQLELVDLLIKAVRKKADLTRAQTDLAKAEGEHADFIALQQKRSELKEAELDAQLAEVALRTARAEYEMRNLGNSAAVAVRKTADEIKMAEVQARERLTRQFSSHLKLGKVLDLAELQKAYTATLRQIEDDASLTEAQRLEAVAFLDQEYERQKASLTKRTSIYGDE